GLTFTRASEVLGTQTYFTDPKAGQRDALMYWTEGGVYPKPNGNITRDSLPLTGELMPVVTKYSRVAPAGITRYRNTTLGNDFQDNLFSAQFNTHRVLRHKLIRDGASFRTEDEVFFSSSNEDFHPTDVLEDGDGSLLVVETGGWFIKGCPLSQVSKPELQGSIYRVRRTGAAKVEDPFGNAVHWKDLDVAAAVKYLEDPRPFVADKAVNNLVDRGEQSIGALANLLKTSGNIDARARAVFALYRVNSKASIEAVRDGLNDKDLQVRVASAKVLGMAKDQGSTEQLLNMVQNDDPACRRQAATALGQIGDSRMVNALLKASDGVKDRFIEHAIIYALISINEPALVKKGLSDPSQNVKKTALIALDQMHDRTLLPGDVTPFLASDDSTLESTARWVVSHHPEWAGNMISYLQRQLGKTELGDDDKKQLREILVPFCGNASMQKFILSQLKEASAGKKLFILEVMNACDIKEVPQGWITQLGRELTSGVNETVKLNVLKLIRLHGITSLQDALEQVAGNNVNVPAIRINAIGTSLSDSTQISKTYFDYLYEQLQPGNDASIRQQAAGVLGQARLSNEMLLKLARDYLGKADAFILPRLMPVFKGASDIEIGKSLANALENSPSLDNITEEYLRETFSKYPPELSATTDKLLAKLKQVRGERLAHIQTIEASITKGDIERGRILFFGKAICNTCHAIGKEGGTFGPDLTSIQRDRSAHDLVEAIVYPGVSFVREFETYEIKTRDNTYRGIIQEQTTDVIRLGISPQESVQIQRKDVISTEIQNVSMMPLGLDKILTEQELADLMAFLLGQDQDPETDAELLRKQNQ
ncbi:MAG TPA: HEAT repeat domain-containing protein, partial [Chryseolinea sp.]